MSGYCTLHSVQMKEFQKEGKSWYSHKLEDGTWCKGEGYGKSVRTGNTDAYKKFQETGAKLFKATEDAGMSKKDWNFKEFTKGLGVYSAAARSEGMDPVTAFREMHIPEWLRVTYGDMEGYEEWINGVKKRLLALAKETEVDVNKVSQEIEDQDFPEIKD